MPRTIITPRQELPRDSTSPIIDKIIPVRLKPFFSVFLAKHPSTRPTIVTG